MRRFQRTRYGKVDTSVLRILDANTNRATEGLRVLEEHARFRLNDSFLASSFKSLRHDLMTLMRIVDRAELLAARDTLRDVGTNLQATDEYSRLSDEDVIAANSSRVEQSIRVLEEYSKISLPIAEKIEALRYRAYSLNRALFNTVHSSQLLAHSRLYVLLDGGSSQAEFKDLVLSLVSAGVSLLQLRDKHLSDRELLERALIARALTRPTRTLFIVNDRPDLANLADADGVHLGQDDLGVHDARKIIGTKKFIGVSTHNFQQVERAVLDGANYIGCGPTFESSTKSFAQFAGIPFLRQVAESVALPAFAIGGIHDENLAEVLATGISRVAVSGAVCRAQDPAHAARRIVDLLSGSSRTM